MSEAGYVELPVIAWLSGHGSYTPGAKGLGWTYRDEATLAAFDRLLTDPLVEPLLIQALQRINADVKTEAQSRLAVNALRKTLTQPDKLTANRETLDLLRDGATVVLTPGEPAKTVRFIEFDPARQHLNDFTATNQYRVQGVRQCRADTVLLVNDIPLVIAEYKSYLASGKDGPKPSSNSTATSARPCCCSRPTYFAWRRMKRNSVMVRCCSTTPARTTSLNISTSGGRGAPAIPTVKAGGTSRKPTSRMTRWESRSTTCCA